MHPYNQQPIPKRPRVEDMWERLGLEEMPSDASSLDRSQGTDREGGSGFEVSNSWETDSSSCESMASFVFSTDISETRKRRKKVGGHLTLVASGSGSSSGGLTPMAQSLADRASPEQHYLDKLWRRLRRRICAQSVVVASPPYLLQCIVSGRRSVGGNLSLDFLPLYGQARGPCLTAVFMVFPDHGFYGQKVSRT